ncbi:hypothetical protein CR513_51074, partial [Mucuna pruriens]
MARYRVIYHVEIHLPLSRSDDSHIEADLLMRENNFHSRRHVLYNLCFVIIDGGSCVNVASERLWLSEHGQLVVDR